MRGKPQTRLAVRECSLGNETGMKSWGKQVDGEGWHFVARSLLRLRGLAGKSPQAPHNSDHPSDYLRIDTVAEAKRPWHRGKAGANDQSAAL